MSEVQMAEAAPEAGPEVTSADLTNNTDASMEAKAQETDGHFEIGSGESLSFDDFEALEAFETKQTRMEAQADLEKEKVKDEIKAESGSDEPSEEKSGEAQEDSKAEQPSEQESPDKQGEPEGEQDQDVQEASGKAFSVQIDGSTLEIPTDTIFKAKVDGQDQDVSIQDLVNDYSGRQAIQKRFDELSLEKQSFVENKRLVDENINEIFTLANEGKAELALQKFFESLGVEPTKAIDSLRTGFIQEAEKLAQMTPEERKAYEAEARAAQYKQQLESVHQSQEAQRSQEALNQRIVDLQKAHSIDDSTFDAVATELIELKEAGRLQQQITPELIVQVAVNDRVMGKSADLLNGINPDIALDANIEVIANMLNGGISEQDCVAFAHAKWGASNPLKAVSQKVRAGSLTDPTRKGAQTPISPQNQDVWDFDQLSY